jgi:hypothetical protein
VPRAALAFGGVECAVRVYLTLEPGEERFTSCDGEFGRIVRGVEPVGTDPTSERTRTPRHSGSSPQLPLWLDPAAAHSFECPALRRG